MKDNTDRLLRATEYPDSFTDSELQALLSDPEVAEFYSLMSRTADALSSPAAPDLDAEWEAFVGNHDPQCSGAPWCAPTGRRRIAAIIAWAIVSLTVIAATLTVTHTFRKDEPHTSVTAPIRADVQELEPIVSDTAAPASVTVVFQDRPLADILAAMEEYYGVTVEYASEAPRDLRLYYQWDQSLPLETVAEDLDNFARLDLSLRGDTIIVEGNIVE
ncbi:MAG: DUF4974 domain-containing protein [Lepagella sp.]